MQENNLPGPCPDGDSKGLMGCAGAKRSNKTEGIMMKQVCATCRFAKGFALGPGISGSEEGVKCTNLEFAKYLDKLQKSDSYQKEFNAHGFINIFRVEAVASNDSEECQFWETQKQKVIRQNN